MDTNEETLFYLDRWLSVNQDDHQICREMPVVRKGAATLPGENHFNPIAFRKAKIAYNVCLSECSRVNCHCLILSTNSSLVIVARSSKILALQVI